MSRTMELQRLITDAEYEGINPDTMDALEDACADESYDEQDRSYLLPKRPHKRAPFYFPVGASSPIDPPKTSEEEYEQTCREGWAVVLERQAETIRERRAARLAGKPADPNDEYGQLCRVVQCMVDRWRVTMLGATDIPYGRRVLYEFKSLIKRLRVHGY